MKRFAIAAAALLWSTPAMAHHLHTRDGVEIEPSHCVFDGIFETWNCWYTPVPEYTGCKYIYTPFLHDVIASRGANP